MKVPKSTLIFEMPVATFALIIVFITLFPEKNLCQIHIYNENGHAYELVREKIPWTSARDEAQMRTPPSGFQQGHLVTFSTQEEENFVLSKFGNELNGAWIGFTDQNLEGEWRWIDDTEGIWQDPNNFENPVQTAHTNWRPSTQEPNNEFGNEHYAVYSVFMAPNPQWNDLPNNNGYFIAYVVEYSPNIIGNTCLNSLPTPMVTSDSICAGEYANLSAYSSRGIIHWYNSEDIPLGVGDTYTTPPLSVATNYYVESVDTISNALQFAGGNNWVNCGNPSGNLFGMLGNGTIEAWVQAQGPLPGYRSRTCNVILGKDQGPGNSVPKWFFGIQNGGLAFHINGPGYFNGYWVYSNAFAQPSPGQWYQVAVVKSADIYTFYFNGTNVGSGALPRPIVVNNAPLTIGWGEPCCQAGAIIDEVRFYNVTRSSEEITSSINQCQESSAIGLIAYYPMNDMQGQYTVKDHSDFGNDGTLINMNPNTVWVEGYDLNCFGACMISDRIEIVATVIPKPNPTIATSSLHICSGQTATLDVGTGYSSYLWSESVENTQSIAVTAGGRYSITVTNAQECSGIDSILITESPQPTISNADIMPDTCGIGEGSIEIVTIEKGAPPYNFLWSNGAVSKNLSGLLSGDYTITLTDSLGCTLLETFSLPSLPTFDAIINSHSPLCPDDEFGSITISTEGETGSYLYSLDDVGFVQDSFFIDVEPGVHTVTVQDINGCEVVKETVILAAPELLLEVLPKDTIIALGDSIKLSFQSNFTPDSFFWEGTELSCRQCWSPNASPSYTQIYKLIAFSSENCLVTGATNIKVNKDALVFIPNVFSPNADKINDYFYVFTGKGIQKIKKFQIFDRWGNLIFSQGNLPLNKPNAGWDGTFRGNPVRNGVFIYFIEIELENGISEIFKGDVMVLR